MNYLYGNMEDGKAGDVVERVNSSIVLKRGLYILEKDVTSIHNIHILENVGSYDGRLFNLVKTEGVKGAKAGDQIICTQITAKYGQNPVIGEVYTLRTDVKNNRSVYTAELPYNQKDFRKFTSPIVENTQFNPRILNENIVINCKTEERAIDLLRWASGHGKKWGSGDSFLYNNEWATHGANTCYEINMGEYCNYKHYDHYNRNIWTYEDALINLKTDDLIEVCNDPH